MKLRIQYMYENAEGSYVVMLLESNSIADFLSQAENMSQITNYDRDMLEEYKKTTEEIQEKEASIQEEQQELEELKQQSLDKQDEIYEVVKTTNLQIQDYEGQISQEIMDRRLQQLMCVQNEIAQKNSEALVGQTLEVLIENQDGLTGMFHGRGIHSAPDGIDGVIKFRACRPHEMGTFTMVRITRARHHDLIGEEVAETETAAA